MFESTKKVTPNYILFQDFFFKINESNAYIYAYMKMEEFQEKGNVSIQNLTSYRFLHERSFFLINTIIVARN